MTQLDITGMTCESCAAHVKHALEQVPGGALGRSVLRPGQRLGRPRRGCLAGRLDCRGDRARLSGEVGRHTVPASPGQISRCRTGICAAENHVWPRCEGIAHCHPRQRRGGDCGGAEGHGGRRARHSDRAWHPRGHLCQRRVRALEDPDPRRPHCPFTPGEPLRHRPTPPPSCASGCSSSSDRGSMSCARPNTRACSPIIPISQCCTAKLASGTATASQCG